MKTTKDEESPKPLPCPKCKTDKDVEIEMGHSPFTPKLLIRFVCKNCGFAGDAGLSPLDAIVAWNRCVGKEME